MSKGSKQRPTDKKSFDENYDKIFRKSDPRILEDSKLEDEAFDLIARQSELHTMVEIPNK